MIGYRKRIRLGPVGVNVSRRGLGVSAGPRHAKVSKSRSGVTFSASLLGLFWRKRR